MADMWESPGRYRKRLERREVPGQVRFLTFSCYRQLHLFANASIRDAFCRHLDSTRDRMRFKIFAWVIMPNHVHLLMDPGEQVMRNILRRAKGDFANAVLRRWRELEAPVLGRVADAAGHPHFWQPGGGYDRNIITPHEFIEKLHYIHNNPGRWNLVTDPTQWRWSSARWYGGDRAPEAMAMDEIEL